MSESLIMHTGGMVATNGYILGTGEEYFVIDAPRGIYEVMKSKGIKPTALLLTHQHYDHIEDAYLFSEAGIPIYAYQQYSPPLVLKEQAERWGFNVKINPFNVSDEINSKEIISVGQSSIVVLHVPGHSPDSIVYYFAGKQYLFSGDTLFNKSIGRSDLPFGDPQILLNGITSKLMTLENSVEVFPGHGEPTSIGEERIGNPFIR